MYSNYFVQLNVYAYYINQFYFPVSTCEPALIKNLSNFFHTASLLKAKVSTHFEA